MAPIAAAPEQSNLLPTVSIGGVRFVSVSADVFVRFVVAETQSGQAGWVVTPNIDILRRHQNDSSFRCLVAPATQFVADGMPIVWASRILGTPLPERIAGSDLFVSLCEAADRASIPILMIGGAARSAEQAAAVLIRRHPKLNIAGQYCPPVGFEANAAELERIAALVSRTESCFIFVGLGSPKQELLIAQMRHLAPRAWWFGVGVSFSFVAGDILRAPEWMQTNGLEWLYRLIQEPKRLFRRYMLHGVPFTIGLILQAGGQRLRAFLTRKAQ